MKSKIYKAIPLVVLSLISAKAFAADFTLPLPLDHDDSFFYCIASSDAKAEAPATISTKRVRVLWKDAGSCHTGVLNVTAGDINGYNFHYLAQSGFRSVTISVPSASSITCAKGAAPGRITSAGAPCLIPGQ